VTTLLDHTQPVSDTNIPVEGKRATSARKDRLVRTSVPGVYKRGGRYCVRYRVRGEERKRYVGTFEEARRLKASITTAIAQGTYRELAPTPFKEYAAEWIGSYAGRTTTGLRDSTRDSYRPSVRAAIAYFGGRCLADIEPRDCRGFVAWLQDPRKQKRALSSATVRKHLAVLKLLLATAVEDGLLRHSPAAHTRVPRPAEATLEPTRARTLDRQQLAAVLDALDPGWRLFFALLAVTGLRIGEALELRWRDVEFGAKRLRVRRQVAKDGTVSPPKTRTGMREVPLSTSVCQRLWRLRGAPDALLFTSPRGLHVDRRWLRRYVLDPATQEAGVPWVTFHTFRHTCASLLFAAGKTPKQVQMWLGHADPAFTLRVYVHLMDDGLGDALDEATWTLRTALRVDREQAVGAAQSA
jgi:integrase